MSKARECSERVPLWKKLIDDARLKEIEQERAKRRELGTVQQEKGGNYKRICPACNKPNSEQVDFCTGCAFPTTEWDLQRLPDNIFLDLAKGKDIGALVHLRTADYAVFDDKYGVSVNHLQIIPTRVIADITELSRADLPTLAKLHALGMAEFERRGLDAFFRARALSEWRKHILSGYNYPVSVKHLHLHMVLPPFKHEKVFQYPRWHAHAKVVDDLQKFGRVRLQQQVPCEEWGAAEYARAMTAHRKTGGQAEYGKLLRLQSERQLPWQTKQ